MNAKNWTVRVYALLVYGYEVLVLHEQVPGGKRIYKYPGGGLEFGEGPQQGLKRELQEELNLDVKKPLQLFFVPQEPVYSWFEKGQQVLPLYYLLKLSEKPHFTKEVEEEFQPQWIEIGANNLKFPDLPSDQGAFLHLLNTKLV